MSEKIFLSHMFPGYQPNEDSPGVFSEILVSSAEIDPEYRLVYVKAFSPNYLTVKERERYEREIESFYDLRRVDLELNFPAHLLSSIHPDELRDLFVSENSMLRGTLAGAQWTWEEQHLNIHMRANGKAMVEEVAGKWCS